MTTGSPNKMLVSTPSEREIMLTRDLDAPRDLVFAALSSAEHIPHWWGRARSTLSFCEIDARPGGHWRFVERDPDGNEFGFHGEFREIDPPRRVVQTFEWEGLPGHISVETMTLEDLGARTRVTIRSMFDTVEDRDGMLQSGMEKGAAESYDRLERYVQSLADARA
ncbi:MAG: SRPBCC family protein [Chloroflexota bacterium]